MASQLTKTNRNATFAVVIGVGIFLSIIAVYYRSNWVEPVATVFLCCITAVYALFTSDALQITQEQLGLMKTENDRRERVLLFVDLSCAPPHLLLHIFNLGLSGFLVQKIVAKSSDDLQEPNIFDLHKIVESGKTETIKLPQDLWDGEACTDFEFVAYYIGINGSGSTAPKCFNVFSFSGLGAPDVPPTITDGLDANWYAYCPTCEMPALAVVHGLKTLEAARARRKQVEEDLALSCPNHQSEWMLTPGKVKETQRARENRRKLS